MGNFPPRRPPSSPPPHFHPISTPPQASLWLVVKQAPANRDLALPLLLFGSHLALGNLWNKVFFGDHQLRPSLPYMGAFWATLAGARAPRARVPACPPCARAA